MIYTFVILVVHLLVIIKNNKIYTVHILKMGTAVAQWLRRCATNRKVAGSIPYGVIGIFH